MMPDDLPIILVVRHYLPGIADYSISIHGVPLECSARRVTLTSN